MNRETQIKDKVRQGHSGGVRPKLAPTIELREHLNLLPSMVPASDIPPDTMRLVEEVAGKLPTKAAALLGRNPDFLHELSANLGRSSPTSTPQRQAF